MEILNTFVEDNNLVILNAEMKCIGEITWEGRGHKINWTTYVYIHMYMIYVVQQSSRSLLTADPISLSIHFSSD